MANVTITQKEYEQLLDAKLRYEYLRGVLDRDLFSPPPTKSKKTVISAFRKTGNYSDKFLKSLERGLRKSSFFKKA